MLVFQTFPINIHSCYYCYGDNFEHRPQIEEEVGCELQVDSVDEGKGEDRNVDMDDGSLSSRVPWNQLFGVIPVELEIGAVDLVRPEFDK